LVLSGQKSQLQHQLMRQKNQH